MSNPLSLLAILFCFLGLLFFLISIAGMKKRKWFASTTNFVTALLMLSLSALSGTLSIAIQGYHALTKEELAATVNVAPTGEQQFSARFSMPDGSEKIFYLAGDQLYVDARILKWKPLANLLGLHTSYELDRVAGRYALLKDERTKVHTVYSLTEHKPLDMFDLRQRFAMLHHLLDAEYGSATFVGANRTEVFQVLVSTTGLLIRKIVREPGR